MLLIHWVPTPREPLSHCKAFTLAVPFNWQVQTFSFRFLQVFSHTSSPQKGRRGGNPCCQSYVKQRLPPLPRRGLLPSQHHIDLLHSPHFAFVFSCLLPYYLFFLLKVISLRELFMACSWLYLFPMSCATIVLQFPSHLPVLSGCHKCPPPKGTCPKPACALMTSSNAISLGPSLIIS